MKQTLSPGLSPWYARVPISFFSIPFGLLGLSGSWHRLVRLGFSQATLISDILLVMGTVSWALLSVFLLLNLIKEPFKFWQTYLHPVQGALMALFPLSALLILINGIQLFPSYYFYWLALVVFFLLIQLAIAWRVVSQLSQGQMPEDLFTPALYLPAVAGGYIGAMALETLGLHGLSILLFGMGLGAWFILEVRILDRLFGKPLPMALRPTLGIELAPIPVGALAFAVLWPDLGDTLLLIALGMSAGPVLAVTARYHWWAQVPFNAGFWSFSFPLAAMASVIAEAVYRGNWPPLVGLTAVLLATAVIVYLLIRSFILLIKGKLLPAAS